MTHHEQPRTMRVIDRRLRRVRLGSAAAVSAIVGVLTAGLVFLTGLLLWRVGVGSGLVERVEEVGATLSADGTFELDGATLFGGWLALGVLWAVTISVLGVVLAMIVNLGCLITGGLRLQLTTEPLPVTAGDRRAGAQGGDRAPRPIEAKDPEPAGDAEEHPPLAA